MFYGLCGPGSWAFPGSYGVWGSIGSILNLVAWMGLSGILALVVMRAARRTHAATGPVRYATGQPSAREILQARYAQGEITREQYERMKQDIG